MSFFFLRANCWWWMTGRLAWSWETSFVSLLDLNCFLRWLTRAENCICPLGWANDWTSQSSTISHSIIHFYSLHEQCNSATWILFICKPYSLCVSLTMDRGTSMMYFFTLFCTLVFTWNVCVPKGVLHMSVIARFNFSVGSELTSVTLVAHNPVVGSLVVLYCTTFGRH